MSQCETRDEMSFLIYNISKKISNTYFISKSSHQGSVIIVMKMIIVLERKFHQKGQIYCSISRYNKVDLIYKKKRKVCNDNLRQIMMWANNYTPHCYSIKCSNTKTLVIVIKQLNKLFPEVTAF